jgi:hypothetical protein
LNFRIKKDQKKALRKVAALAAGRLKKNGKEEEKVKKVIEKKETSK